MMPHPTESFRPGEDLENSGHFGPILENQTTLNWLLSREQKGRKRTLDLSRRWVPENPGVCIDKTHSRVYSGQFSQSGDLYFAGCQDFAIRLYDSSDPYKFRLKKVINAIAG